MEEHNLGEDPNLSGSANPKGSEGEELPVTKADKHDKVKHEDQGNADILENNQPLNLVTQEDAPVIFGISKPDVQSEVSYHVKIKPPSRLPFPSPHSFQLEHSH